MNGSEEIASETYSLTLGVYDRTTINFGSFELNETTNITVQLGESDNLSSDDQINQEISIGTVQQQAIVRVSTDNFGQYCRWRIRNDNNQIVASRGPYANHSNTSTFELQMQDPQTINLTENGCYTFEAFDAAGNGMFFFQPTFLELKIWKEIVL
jgi:hypothetical protein